MTLDKKEAWLRSLLEDHAEEPRLTDLRWAVEVIDALKADNARLRALVKDSEWQGCTGRDSDPACPWCGAEPEPIGNGLHSPRASGRHASQRDCPAFTPEGVVK